ncbi:DAK2 domain-containing protein [Bacillus taeanensis]|uniref:DhaL domain-containing protein n=1 Tax=Bacillus taeanensis TaxID=273032 RepID=A0A366XP52_9BACI|nr:DAK2 domain-containing protein [Bacillus taeanensis]RBW67516.1 hypothetical protein DS031_21785 [Bacillus taeanensis]
MTTKQLDGKQFAAMIREGANFLTQQVKVIDTLNVFPVPDGDTGTNMNLTMISGVQELAQVTNNHVGEAAKAFSRGLLMGARGNSGVILSQLLRGFSKAVESKEVINAQDLAQALQQGVQTAYKAVMKPVEGTILTVAKDAANKATRLIDEGIEDIVYLIREVTKEAKISLNKTPELLPVLKEVGVVDSGGKGLVVVYEGILAFIEGRSASKADNELSIEDMIKVSHHQSAQSHMKTEDIEFGYCTEFMVKLEADKIRKYPFDEKEYQQILSKFGDSLLVVADEEFVKVHIHAETPGEVMTISQKYGSLIDIKIENMREQHSRILEEYSRVENVSKPKQKYGIVTVGSGEGIIDLFNSIGAGGVIEGGQTMNPSTEQIEKAISEVHAEAVFVLPNNSNIIMTAEQAASLSEKNVIVIPTKTIPQGISSLLAFNPEAELDENKANMREAVNAVKSGQITYAVRDTVVDNLEIYKGDFLGILDGVIKTASKNRFDCTKNLLQAMLNEESEIITLIIGTDVETKEVDELTSFLTERYEEVEIEVHKGNQPVYAYIISVE